MKSNKHILRLNILFNIFIVSLFAASLFLILWTAYLNRYTDETDDLNKLRVTASDQVREDKTKRDIYYLIFDQYSRGDILKKVYDYDNSQFTESLEKRGFYIADMSYSNYPHTLHSLASSLNMDYLNYLTEQQRGKGNWSNALQVLIKHNKVCKRLVSMGYQCIDLAHFTIEGGELSEKINKEISSEVSRMLAKETTIIEIIYGKSMFPIILRDFVKKEVDKIARVNKSRISKREDILLKFSKLIEIPDYQEPTLTILHLLIPYHSPFVFDRHGNYVSLEEERSRSKTDNYVEQLKYLNNKILESIDIIIEKSDPKPIIVIQADEGTYPNGYNHIERDLTIYPAEMLRHKFAIFNAYYLPDVDNTYLYPSITPVNTFRLIFNLYLSGNYDFLPEKHYNTNYANYYRYVDIMDKIKDN